MSVTKFDKLEVNSIKIGNNGNLNVLSNNIKYTIQNEGEFSVLVKDKTNNDTSGKIMLASQNGKIINNNNNSIDNNNNSTDDSINDNSINNSINNNSINNSSNDFIDGYGVLIDKENIKIGYSNFNNSFDGFSENMTSGIIINKDKIDFIGDANVSIEAEAISDEEINSIFNQKEV